MLHSGKTFLDPKSTSLSTIPLHPNPYNTLFKKANENAEIVQDQFLISIHSPESEAFSIAKAKSSASILISLFSMEDLWVSFYNQLLYLYLQADVFRTSWIKPANTTDF